MEAIDLSLKISKASPPLFLAVATGKHFPQAVITVRSAGEEPHDFLKWILTDVVVSSYSTAAAVADDSVSDRIMLSFNRIQVEYRQILATGALGPAVKAGWDIKKNAAI
jgi:type VI secretion system secreted protein Hcp